MPKITLYGLRTDRGTFEEEFAVRPNKKGTKAQKLAFCFDEAAGDIHLLKKNIKKQGLIKLFNSYISGFEMGLREARTIEQIRQLCWLQRKDYPSDFIDVTTLLTSSDTDTRKRKVDEEPNIMWSKKAHIEAPSNESSNIALAIDAASSSVLDESPEIRLKKFIKEKSEVNFFMICAWLTNNFDAREAWIHEHLIENTSSSSSSKDARAQDFLQALKANYQSSKLVHDVFINYIHPDIYKFILHAPPLDYLKKLLPTNLLLKSKLFNTFELAPIELPEPADIYPSPMTIPRAKKLKSPFIIQLSDEVRKGAFVAARSEYPVNKIKAFLQKYGPTKGKTVEFNLEKYWGGMTPLIASMFLTSHRVITRAFNHLYRDGSKGKLKPLFALNSFSTAKQLTETGQQFLIDYEKACIEFIEGNSVEAIKAIGNSNRTLPIPIIYKDLILDELSNPPGTCYKELFPYIEDRRIPTCQSWFCIQEAGDIYNFPKRENYMPPEIVIKEGFFSLQLKLGTELSNILQLHPYQTDIARPSLFFQRPGTSIWESVLPCPPPKPRRRNQLGGKPEKPRNTEGLSTTSIVTANEVSTVPRVRSHAFFTAASPSTTTPNSDTSLSSNSNPSEGWEWI